MLLHKPPRGDPIPKGRLEERLELFARDDSMPLLRASEQVAEAGAQASARRARRPEAIVEKRAARAPHLVQMGESSSDRQALEGAELAPGTLATLAALSDPERRPPEPRDLMPRESIHHRPRVEFDLTSEGLCKNLRTSQRGAAAVRRMHLRVLLRCPMPQLHLLKFSRLCHEQTCPTRFLLISCVGWWPAPWPSSSHRERKKPQRSSVPSPQIVSPTCSKR